MAGNGSGVRQSLSSILDQANRGTTERRTLPTGFGLIDRVIGGGLRTRNLTLLAGAPGVGKTITALQWARNIAHRGSRVVFVCYEHDEITLLSRLLHLELGDLPPEIRATEDGRAGRRLLRQVEGGEISLSDAVAQSPSLREPYLRVQDYSERLWLVRASGDQTDLDRLSEMVSTDTDALFVDYLQKVPVGREMASQAERVTTISQTLKDIAMSQNVAVVAVAAADREGLDAPRLRLNHLAGSASVAYEADVVIMMNDKYRIVSRSQMTHDLTSAEGFKNQVVFTVEKNRDGADRIDFEFNKQFEYLRFNPEGKQVSERLIDERLFLE